MHEIILFASGVCVLRGQLTAFVRVIGKAASQPFSFKKGPGEDSGSAQLLEKSVCWKNMDWAPSCLSHCPDVPCYPYVQFPHFERTSLLRVTNEHLL